ncbi:LPXTG cell wall anchor domain-containing protein [Streptomyces sp. NPDC055400]
MPLATAGAAYAQDPYPPHSTSHPYPPKPHHPHHDYPPKPHHPHHDYPPKPHKPHGSGHGDGHKGDWDGGYGDEHKGDWDGGHGDGRNGGHRPPHLANTGDDSTKNVVLGSVAAGLIAAGAGTLLVVRRRHNS